MNSRFITAYFAYPIFSFITRFYASYELKSNLGILSKLPSKSNSFIKGIIIVSGGRGAEEQISEAKTMKNYLVNKEINESLIIEEDKNILKKIKIPTQMKILFIVKNY